MNFEFDDAKQASNLRKHGIDLRDTAYVFLDPHRFDLPDLRKDYGEDRRICVGLVLNRVWVVIYTQRADAIRLISARKANEREKNRYNAIHT
jgi:uncharacterized protein